MKVIIPRDCAEPINGNEIVCQEKRCKITFRNLTGRNVIKYKIDKCPELRALLENSGGKLCDFLVAVESSGEEHYIELKGKNVEHALKQLDSTIKQVKLVNPAKSVFCWIIATESPPESSHFQILRTRFEKRLKVIVKIRTLKYEHRLT